MLAGVLALVYFVLPDGTGAESIRVIAPAIGVGAVLMGIATYQPERTLPWAFLAIALGCLAASSAVWSTLYFASHETFPSIADAFHLLSRGPARRHRSVLGHDTAAEDALSGIETTIVSVAVGVGVWLIVIEPFLGDHGVATGDQVWAASIPLLDAVALADRLRTAMQVRFRVPLRRPRRGRSRRASSPPTSPAARRNCATPFGPGGLFAALSVAAPLVLASSALDPTMALTHLPDDDRRRSGSVGWCGSAWPRSRP